MKKEGGKRPPSKIHTKNVFVVTRKEETKKSFTRVKTKGRKNGCKEGKIKSKKRRKVYLRDGGKEGEKYI